MKLDLSLANKSLYAGCEIEEVAGRANLKTPVAEAVNLVSRNVRGIVEATPAADRGEITLRGPPPEGGDGVVTAVPREPLTYLLYP